MANLPTMGPYRAPVAAEAWTVSITAKGPLGPVEMVGNVRAFDEASAVERFTARLQGEGFEVVGEASARRAEGAATVRQLPSRQDH